MAIGIEGGLDLGACEHSQKILLHNGCGLMAFIQWSEAKGFL